MQLAVADVQIDLYTTAYAIAWVCRIHLLDEFAIFTVQHKHPTTSPVLCFLGQVRLGLLLLVVIASIVLPLDYVQALAVSDNGSRVVEVATQRSGTLPVKIVDAKTQSSPGVSDPT